MDSRCESRIKTFYDVIISETTFINTLLFLWLSPELGMVLSIVNHEWWSISWFRAVHSVPYISHPMPYGADAFVLTSYAIFGPNTYMLTGACLPSASTLSYRASCVCGGSHHCFHNLSSVLSFLATFIAKIIIGNIIMFAILLHCSHAGNTSIFQLGR